MTKPDSDRLESLIARCLAATADRAAAVERACSDNPDLADALRERLGHLERVGLLSGAETSGPVLPAGERPGDTIGPYRIVERLGEGGMGAVFLGEQSEPVRRQVALKVIRSGMDTAQILRRFEAERQALALMSHDNIARIHDAGTTDRGAPYFAMEYVEGKPFTAYCDDRRLSLTERLRLFRAVCDGVQHAHVRGIIHRDLKPSNILVTEQGGRPVAKIIDFGLARATESRDVPDAGLTDHGQMLGTPEYMSPEQATPGADHEVDTRTDVYALGVLLYETLTGQLPFDSTELRRAGVAEMQRRIREVDPPKPSTRATPQTEITRAAAHVRRCTQPGLGRALRGELDWVVMRALEKDKDRRYSSAEAFGDDIGRLLRHEPVTAGPASPLYALRKTARRHRIGLAAAALLTLGLAGGAVAWLERTRANQAQRLADREEEIKREALRVVCGVFNAVDPGRSATAEDALRKLFEQGEALARTALAPYPGEALPIFANLVAGRLYLGDWQASLRLVDDALALAERHDLPVAPRLWNVIGAALAENLDPARAEPVLRRAAQAAGEDRDLRSHILHNLALTLTRLGRLPEALEIVDQGLREPATEQERLKWLSLRGTAEFIRRDFRAALATRRAVLAQLEQNAATDAKPLARAINDVAVVQLELGEWQDAAAMAERGLDLRQSGLDPNCWETVELLTTRGVVLGRVRQYAAAAKDLTAAFELGQRLRPAWSDRMLAIGQSLTTCLRRTGETDRALAEGERLVASARARPMPGAQALAVAQSVHGQTLERAHRFEEAIAHLRPAVDVLEEGVEKGSATVVLGACYLNTNQPAAAEPLLRRVLAAREAEGAEAWRIASSRGLIGHCLSLQERFEAAESLLLEADATLRRELPDGHRRRAISRDHLVSLYERWGRPERAAAWR